MSRVDLFPKTELKNSLNPMLYYLVYYYFLIVCTAFFSLSGKEERHKPVAKLCRVIIKSAQSYIKMLIYLCFAHGFCEESFTEDR
jgi:hypothetical protein